MHKLAGNQNTSFTPEDLITGDKQVVTGPVVVAEGSGEVAALTVMGVVTATGKSKPSLAAAEDGSEVPDHILADAVDATSADATVGAYFEGQFNPDLLKFGAGHTAASVKQALREKGIYLRKPG